MEFKCDSRKLEAAVNVAARFVPSESTIPARMAIQFTAGPDGVHLEAANHDQGTSVRLILPDAEVITPGVVVAAKDELVKLAKAAPGGTLALMASGTELTVSAARRWEVVLPTPDPRTFPAVGSMAIPPSFTVASGDLLRAVRRVLHVTRSKDQLSYAVPGLLLEWGADFLALVALDGSRLVRQQVPAALAASPAEPGSGSFHTAEGPVIPSRFAGTLTALLGGEDGPVEVGVDSHSICFRMPGLSVAVRRLSAKFARYWMIPPIPETARISVIPGDFAKALESVLIVSDQETVRANLAFESGLIVVSSPGTGQGRSRAEVDCGYDGPPFNLAYRGDHLLAPLAGLGPDPVELILHGQNAPADYRAAGYWHRCQPVVVEPQLAAQLAAGAQRGRESETVGVR